MGELVKLANEKYENLKQEYKESFTPERYETHELQKGISRADNAKMSGLALGTVGALSGAATYGPGLKSRAIGGLGLGALGGTIGALAGALKKPQLETKYKTPVYSDEQQDKQEQFWEQKKYHDVADYLGYAANSGKKYDGPDFSEVLGSGVTDRQLEYIKKYPYLTDAIKQDGRTDRGGILWNFEDNMHWAKDDEERGMIAQALKKQLDNNEFYGWKNHWSPEALQDYLKKESHDVVGGLAKLATLAH